MNSMIRRMFVAASVALMPALVFAGPAAAAKGGSKAKVQQCKQSGGMGFRNLGQCVSSSARGVPPPAPSATLDLSNDTYACPNPNSPTGICWGTLTGSGLTPNSAWFVFDGGVVITNGQTDSTGSIGLTQLNIECTIPPGQFDIGAQADDPAGPTGHIFAEAESPSPDLGCP